MAVYGDVLVVTAAEGSPLPFGGGQRRCYKHPTMHGTALYNKEIPGPNASGAEVEKSCLGDPFTAYRS